jgi:hypothetical protein
VNTSISNQLTGLELRLSEIVHPGWVTLHYIKSADPTKHSESSISYMAVLSRHLIDEHKLVPLDYAMFSHDWMYTIVGGHKAVRALSCQLTTYLIATWVQGVISGNEVRALHVQLGKDVYEQALRQQQPLRLWSAPKLVPDNLLVSLAEQTQILLEALWLHKAPMLSPWANLMSAPIKKPLDDSFDFSKQELTVQFSPSTDLINEINQRLQTDFEIDIAATFEIASPLAM